MSNKIKFFFFESIVVILGQGTWGMGTFYEWHGAVYAKVMFLGGDVLTWGRFSGAVCAGAVSSKGRFD